MENGELIVANYFKRSARTGDLRGRYLWHKQFWFSEDFALESGTFRLGGNRQIPAAPALRGGFGYRSDPDSFLAASPAFEASRLPNPGP